MRATIVNYLRPTSAFGALMMALMVLTGIALLDYFTGTEVSFSISYLAAVGVAAWFGGRACGIWISILSAIVCIGRRTTESGTQVVVELDKQDGTTSL